MWIVISVQEIRLKFSLVIHAQGTVIFSCVCTLVCLCQTTIIHLKTFSLDISQFDTFFVSIFSIFAIVIFKIHGLYIVFTLLPSDISQKFLFFNSSISCFGKIAKLMLFQPVSVDLLHLAIHFNRHRSTEAAKYQLALQFC